jgi:hypothetical protein
MNQGLGRRPTARCLNPKCKLTITWRHGQKPPARCPMCGYAKSQEDLTRIREKLADVKAREADAAFEKSFREAIMKLAWWKRWIIGLGMSGLFVMTSDDGNVVNIGDVTLRRRMK